MATLARIKAVWTNFPGAPGYTNFYTKNTALASQFTAIRAFFQAHATTLPVGLQVAIQSTADLIDDSTGLITGSTTATPPSVVTGTNVSPYSGASGAVINWQTAGVVSGRRVRGRTFMVPLAQAFDTVGSLEPTVQAGIQTAASALVTAMGGDMVVWHRPKGVVAGSSHVVTAASVPDLAAVLRSRRT